MNQFRFSRPAMGALFLALVSMLTGMLPGSSPLAAPRAWAAFDAGSGLNASRVPLPLVQSGPAVAMDGASEQKPQSAVIDSTNGYAYYGLNTSPGKVVKVRLSDFKWMDVLTLNTGEDALYAAAIDTVNGYAYFGTSTIPGIIVKVDINPARPFARVAGKTLSAGEDMLHSAVIDTANGYVYFGTNTSPGKVVRLSLSDFTSKATVTLSSVASLDSAVIDTVHGFAYFAADDSSGKVAKVNIDPTNFAEVGTGLTTTTYYFRSAVIDTANSYAYFGSGDASGKIVRVHLSDFTSFDTLTVPLAESGLLTAAIDLVNHYAYFGTYAVPGKLVKIDLLTFTRVNQTVTLSPGEDYPIGALLDPTTNQLYLGTWTSPSIIVKVNVSNPAANPPSEVAAVRLDPGQNNPSVGVIDAAHGFAYFATLTTPADIVKFDLSTFAVVDKITLDAGSATAGEGQVGAAVLDPVHGYAYFGTKVSPRVVKVDINPAHTFARVGVWYPTIPPLGFTSAVIDSANQFAYFGTGNAPGQVFRLDVDPAHTFEGQTASLVVLGTGEDNLTAAGIDPAAGYAYFGTNTATGHIARVDINPLHTFAESGAALNVANPLASSVVDTVNGYAYFGSGTGADPGKVFQVKLSDFSLPAAGTVTLVSGETDLTSAVIDTANGYAYFGTSTTPGKVVQVDVNPTRTLARTGRVAALATGGDNLQSAVIDTSHGFAYFGAKTSPGLVIKFDLQNTATTVLAGTSPSVYGQPVTFTATVSPLTSGTPAGSVQFASDAVNFGSPVSVSGGSATSAANSSLGAGSHTITAGYLGDTNLNASSGSIVQVVNPANTTTTVVASANPSLLGVAVTFTATVAAVAPGGGTPGGSVQFKADGANLGAAVTLSSGSAGVSTAALSAGTHVIAAVYSGGTNFGGSNSNSLSHAVNVPEFKLSLPLLVR